MFEYYSIFGAQCNYHDNFGDDRDFHEYVVYYNRLMQSVSVDLNVKIPRMTGVLSVMPFTVQRFWTFYRCATN